MGEHGRSRTSACVRSLVAACMLVAGLSLAVSALAAPHAKLVKDINPEGAPSYPDQLANVSGTLFFSAYDDDHGTELWTSDGTNGGTKLVKDIRPGGGLSGGSVPLEITSFRGLAFFRADDDAHSGYELWRSDGTKRGTRLVKDINPSSASEPGEFATVGGTLFFSAYEPGGYGLWRSNGTKRGTKLVKHVQAEQLTNSGGTLFFRGSDATHGEELWTSDGTKKGTRILTDDVNPGPDSSYPDYLINVGDTLFFELWNGSQNWLWKSDGTKAGTKLVKKIDATYSASVGGTLFFNGDDDTHGEELWKSDGTKSGTKLVKDINTTIPGANSSLRTSRAPAIRSSSRRTTARMVWSCGSRTGRSQGRSWSRTSIPLATARTPRTLRPPAAGSTSRPLRSPTGTSFGGRTAPGPERRLSISIPTPAPRTPPTSPTSPGPCSSRPTTEPTAQSYGRCLAASSSVMSGCRSV